MSGEITHGWTSAETPDGSDVTPTNFNNHTVTYAAAADLAPVAPGASAGTDATKLPRSDHGHQDSAAGRIYAYLNFR